MILPEALQLVIEGILLGDRKCSNRLPWIFLRIPDLPGILDGLIFKILAQLELQQVFSIMLPMKVLEPFVKDIRRIRVGLDGLFVELFLGRRIWHEAVLSYIVAEAIRSLRVLAG